MFLCYLRTSTLHRFFVISDFSHFSQSSVQVGERRLLSSCFDTVTAGDVTHTKSLERLELLV